MHVVGGASADQVRTECVQRRLRVVLGGRREIKAKVGGLPEAEAESRRPAAVASLP